VKSHKAPLKVNQNWTRATFWVVVLGFIVQIIEMIHHPVAVEPDVFMILASALTVILCYQVEKAFLPLYLISTFTLMVSWRLSAFRAGGDHLTDPQHHATRFEWQLFFIRLYLGFDLVPHFTEKLLAGAAVRAGDISAFIQLNVPHPVFMVWLAGLCELGGAIALGCGFLTRLGSFGLFVYLMIATILGHHFSNGFIWANAGGGWEYPVLWSVLVLTFVLFGAGNFSVDRYLKDHYQVPRWIRHLMGGRHS
jgi:uncharacterized membrane protein YphA (DoxX/SURF4 family)